MLYLAFYYIVVAIRKHFENVYDVLVINKFICVVDTKAINLLALKTTCAQLNKEYFQTKINTTSLNHSTIKFLNNLNTHVKLFHTNYETISD